MPHSEGFQPVDRGCRRSAAKTPNWHVNELDTRTRVFTSAYGTFRCSLLARRDLTIAEATWAMQQVMDGLAPSAALAGFLVALRAKGETVAEIVGFRDAVLARAVPLAVDPAALDIVGTGGDGFRTVNVS